MSEVQKKESNRTILAGIYKKEGQYGKFLSGTDMDKTKRYTLSVNRKKAEGGGENLPDFYLFEEPFVPYQKKD